MTPVAWYITRFIGRTLLIRIDFGDKKIRKYILPGFLEFRVPAIDTNARMMPGTSL